MRLEPQESCVPRRTLGTIGEKGLPWERREISMSQNSETQNKSRSSSRSNGHSFSVLRLLIVCLLLIGVGLYIHTFDRTKAQPIKKPLSSFPDKISGWHVIDQNSMSPQVEKMLGVDDYVLRSYSQSPKSINLYVSYFSYTSRNKGYHSPLNCMPGSGWNIAQTRPIQLSLNNQQQKKVTVNQLILQKGSQKQVALYWYQCRGRIIHSEYWERIYRVWDSIIRGRTDGSFVRLIYKSSSRDLDKATLELKDFAKAVIPTLSNYLP